MNRIQDDRAAQLVMAAGAGTYADARKRLERASLKVRIDKALMTTWGQAALLTVVACASRMFLRGVYIDISPSVRCALALHSNWPLVRLLLEHGAKIETAPDDAFLLDIGHGTFDKSADLCCWAANWTANVAPACGPDREADSNSLAGAVAGGLAVTQAFRARVLGDALATRKPQSLNLWEGATTAAVEYLPTALWLIGLGNLGQATLLLLGLLPFADAGAVRLLLQDGDITGPENLSTQILTRHDWIERKKARNAAAWAERLGFSTTVTERRFLDGDGPKEEEPRVALVGVDNLEARRAVAAANFELVVDAGLGATGSEAFDIRVHAFPGHKSPQAAWPEIEQAAALELTPALQALVDDGQIDTCGAMTIAGKSVGVPCTAIVAAAIQVTQMLRAISGPYDDLIDVSLRDCRRAVMRRQEIRRVIPFQRALDQ